MSGFSRTGAFVAMSVLLAVVTPVAAQSRGPATATVTPLVGSDGVHPGGELHTALQIHLPEGYHVNSNKPRDPSLIPVTLFIEPTPDFTVSEIVWPEALDLKQQGSDQALRVFERDFTIGVTFKIAANASPGDVPIPARLRYQACDETTCYLPKMAATAWVARVVPAGTRIQATNADQFARIAFGHGEAPAAVADPAAPITSRARAASGKTPDREVTLDAFTVSATAAGYLGTDDFLAFVHDAESGVVQKGWFEGRGPVAILLLVLIGGLALNLTPCVLPMIPINLAIIGAGAKAGSRGRGFLLGAAYGAAMALVYGVLGLVVILTAGTFGTINASPWFNAGIAVLFVVLALAMFDVVTIDFSRFSSRFNVSEAGRGSFAVAFAMGGVAALLAGACVAPVVVQVVLFSSNLYATGTTVALALPFVLGLGMAAPWPIAGAGLAALPRPGAWMVRVKQVFGAAILVTAVYYGYEAYVLFANRWVDASEVASSVQDKVKEGWHASLADGLATANREQKPVLIDMWATWCKNCLVMDRTTLEDPAVTSALSGYVKIKFQAEDPDDPPVRDVMRRFNAAGLPTYVILKPKT